MKIARPTSISSHYASSNRYCRFNIRKYIVVNEHKYPEIFANDALYKNANRLTLN